MLKLHNIASVLPVLVGGGGGGHEFAQFKSTVYIEALI